MIHWLVFVSFIYGCYAVIHQIREDIREAKGENDDSFY